MTEPQARSDVTRLARRQPGLTVELIHHPRMVDQ
jgi:hypothetical protein